jgi:dihydrofolate reductase
MPLTILYIATSIDGFIARPDGNLDWLTSTPMPESGDYGYTALLESTDTIIMGRKTYDELIGFGGEWPYSGFNTYVVSNPPLQSWS